MAPSTRKETIRNSGERAEEVVEVTDSLAAAPQGPGRITAAVTATNTATVRFPI
jgi:hypothetical protein